MRAIVQKWGNSAAVRIPAGIMEAARFSLDMPVDVHEQEGRIIIEPIQVREFDIARLLADITPENLHSEIDCRAPLGKEML